MKTFPVNMKFVKPGASVRATVCRYICEIMNKGKYPVFLYCHN